MKILQLTQEQEAKLLEMAKKLFPKYKGIYLRHYYSQSDYNFMPESPDKKLSNDCVCLDFLIEKIHRGNDFEEDGKGYSIHWFEFCFTYLIDKIIYLLDTQTNGTGLVVSEELEHLLNTKTHPVDYLYNQYKELTK
jgi:hypothetical protein